MNNQPPDYEKNYPRRLSQGQGPPPQQYGQGPPPQQYGPPHTNQPNMQGGQMHMNQSFNHGQVMPPPQHTTTVIVQQPQAVQNNNILGQRDGHRDWNSGLFSCCDDVGKCMYAIWCPSCVTAEISARLGECCCVTCCVPGGLATIRTRVRTLGGIRGSICKDYLVTVFCNSCAMCQIHRELDHMEL